MPRLLTHRKQAWVEKRKPDVVRGAVLNNPSVLEARYYQKLASLIERMTADTERQIRKLFDSDHAEEFFAQDMSIAAQARIITNALTAKFDSLFGERATDIAAETVNAANAASSTAMHASLKELSGGLTLPTNSLSKPMKQVLKASVTENVGLIKSISAQYLQSVQGSVMRSITTGNGLKDLVPALQKSKEITLRRARMIAADQNRKIFQALNKGRMQALGLQKYEWLHVASAHPRKLHQEYSGKIFDLNDPPIIVEETGERGIPGQAINCRCKMIPVIEFSSDD